MPPNEVNSDEQSRQQQQQSTAPEDVEVYEDASDTITTTTKMDLSTAIEDCGVTLHLMLGNRVNEARNRLLPWVQTSTYHALSNAAIWFMQAFMTCDPVDIEAAVEALKKAMDVISAKRRKGTISNNSVTKMVKKPNYNNYSEEEIHAELCYTEAMLVRCVLSLLQDDSLMTFVKNGLRLRSCFLIYKECQDILKHRNWRDASSKMHFESGVLLGIGAFNLLMSLLPAKVLRLLEFVGFSGNKEVGLKNLDSGLKMNDSLRGPLCSLYMLGYHTVIIYALGNGGGGDLEYAKAVLEPEFKRHPKAAIFLYFAGKIAQIEGNTNKSISLFTQSLNAQDDWRQFHLLCYWELSWCHAFLGQWRDAMQCMEFLHKGSQWSKSISAYLKASMMCMCKLDLDGSIEENDELTQLMNSVPLLRRRIAGKSIPMEKFFSKRSQKFFEQDHWLLLPAIETMYFMNFMTIAKNSAEVMGSIYGMIERALDEVVKMKNSKYYIDNYCLALFLKGVSLRFLGSPLVAEECFIDVIKNSKKLLDDHHLVPFSFLELGFLFTELHDYSRATEYLEAARNYKGCSMESKLHFKVHAGLQDIRERLKLNSSPLVKPSGLASSSPTDSSVTLLKCDGITNPVDRLRLVEGEE